MATFSPASAEAVTEARKQFNEKRTRQQNQQWFDAGWRERHVGAFLLAYKNYVAKCESNRATPMPEADARAWFEKGIAAASRKARVA